MVIFLFLRTLPATIIPSVAVPLSLVGTFGVMYLLGYSLNNLTLMALTISTGFVVDDAIVMIENIVRYIEEGDAPLEAALKGSGADRLHDPVADRVADRGADSAAVHGRHRRPAVPRVRRDAERHHPGLGVRVADADADDVRAASAAHAGAQQGGLYRASERDFRSGHRVLRRDAATGCCGTRARRCWSRSRRWSLTVVLYIVVPKGFFPVQDTGVILGISEAPQTHLVRGDGRAPAGAGRRDPEGSGGREPVVVHRRRRHQHDAQQRPHPDQPEAARRAQISASDVIRRLQPELAEVDGITLFMQPVQDLTVEDRVSRTQYQFSLEDADAAS